MPTTGPWPLTAAQQGIWLAEQLRPGHSGYHDTAVLRITGELDPDVLHQALRDAQSHHDALRCRVNEVDGVPVQMFDCDSLDYSYRCAATPDEPVERLVGLDGNEPFDLCTGPVWRVRLVRTGRSEHLLIVVTHHLVTDGWSHGVFLRALLACYLNRASGVPPRLPVPAMSYPEWIVDKVRRERQAARPERLRTAAARFADAPRRLPLPGTVDGASGGLAAVVPVPVSDADCAAFVRACARHGVTGYMGLAGLFARQLAGTAAAAEVVLAAPVAYRSDPRTRALMGCLVDNVAVHVRVDAAATATQVLVAGRTGVLAALEYADVPYRDLARAAGAATGTDDPLTNVSLKEFNAPMGRQRVGGLEIEPLPRTALRTRHDLAVSVAAGLQEPPELLIRAGGWQPGAAERFAADLAGQMRAVASAT